MSEWPLITDHVWRGKPGRPCVYAWCGQPLAEYESAKRRTARGRPARADRKPDRRVAA